MPRRREELDFCVRFWESEHLDNRWIMNPTVEYYVKLTIKLLKELVEIKESKQILVELRGFVGDGFCIAPKVVLTNDEVGWYATFLPNAPESEGEVAIVGDTPLDALTKLKVAVQQLGGGKLGQ